MKSPLAYQQHKTTQRGVMKPQLNTDMKQGSTSVMKSNALSFLLLNYFYWALLKVY